MPAKGREHFDHHAPQTAIKHAIFEKYFAAYLTVLRTRTDAFHYVDGFAGRGKYGNQPGSALRAIAALKVQSLPSTVSLVEADRKNFAALEEALREHLRSLEEPLRIHDEFANCLPRVLGHPIYRKYRSVATFAFIDPCGVSGVRMEDLARLLVLPRSECLLFWNYDGLIRLLGAVASGTCQRSDLENFFGSGATLERAFEVVRRSKSPRLRERRLLDLYLGALSPKVARFLIPFRFRAAERDKTSHYLVHCSNHPRAFTIMKDVMWRLTTEGSEAGIFQFLHDDDAGRQGSLFGTATEVARQEILDELAKGEQPVELFRKHWIERPHDLFVESQYRQILLDLEREGLVTMIDPATGKARPAAARIRGGKVTLAEGLHVRLSGRTALAASVRPSE